MGKLVDNGNRGNVQSIARVSFEGADSALTQNDIVIPTGHDVLGGEQQFLESRGNPALQQDRLLHLPQFAQQIEILHIAGADLQNVNIGCHDVDLRNLHDLADDEQFETVAGLPQQL